MQAKAALRPLSSSITGISCSNLLAASPPTCMLPAYSRHGTRNANHTGQSYPSDCGLTGTAMTPCNLALLWLHGDAQAVLHTVSE